MIITPGQRSQYRGLGMFPGWSIPLRDKKDTMSPHLSSPGFVARPSHTP